MCRRSHDPTYFCDGCHISDGASRAREKDQPMNKKLNPSRAFSGIMDWGVFLVASIVLFLKTSDVFTYYSPHQIGGYSGIEPIYGIVCASIVEGYIVYLKFSVKLSENDYAYLWNVGTMIMIVVISGIAQIVDGWISTSTLAQQPQTIQMVVQWFVPLLPWAIMVILLIKTTIAVLPQNAKVPESSRKVTDWRNLGIN